MKIGDNVVIVSRYGEFQCNIEGTIVSFYREDRAVVRTEAGHDWAIEKRDLRVVKEQHSSGWVQ